MYFQRVRKLATWYVALNIFFRRMRNNVDEIFLRIRFHDLVKYLNIIIVLCFVRNPKNEKDTLLFLY